MRANCSLIILTGFLCIPLTGCTELIHGFQSGYHFSEGDGFYRSGQDGKAEQAFKECIQISKVTTGCWDEEAKSLVRLGQIYAKAGRESEAGSCLDQALNIFQRNEDSRDMKLNHPRVKDFWIIGLHSKAEQLRKHNRAAEADELEAKAKGLQSKT